MRQGTTPTHTFRLPCRTSEVAEARITYVVDNEVLLEKVMEDCECAENTFSVTLTQEETFKFEADKRVHVQVRVLTDSGQAFTSAPSSFYVERAYNKEVLG